MKPKIKLIALDLDETLLDKEKKISDRNRKAIEMARAQGIKVTLATGRMYCSALSYARVLGLDMPLITYNGALVKDGETEQVLYHQPLPTALTTPLLSVFQEHNWYVQSYIRDELWVANRTDITDRYERLIGTKAHILGEEYYHLSDPITSMLAMGEASQVQQVRDILTETFGEALRIFHSMPHYVEILHPAVNKGAALAALADRLGIARAEVMAIGDSQNDKDMLAYAGWGIAMDNANDEIKHVAREVTSHYQEHGVAIAIEKWVL